MDTKIIRAGRVATYFPDRGYGFIYEDTKDGKLCSWFFHVRACCSEPKVGLKVQFKIAPGPKGLMAVDIGAPGIAPGIETLAGGAL
jgi:cold shock CspA family protein